MNDAAETRRRILDETIKVIEAEGDPAVRVAKVANAAGVTQGMVTYHFRTRSRLIAEAHAERFAATMNDDITVATEAMASVTTREQAMALVGNLTTAVLSSVRAEARRKRVSVLGYAVADHELATEVSAIQTRLFDEFSKVFDIAIDRGLIRPGLTSRALVTMISAYSLGLILTNFDATPPSSDELAAVIKAFIDGVIAG
jgi:AcrR family transcriptional regulator